MSTLPPIPDHPLTFQRMMWPSTVLYKEQREMVMSVREAVETVVVAGNQLGKDYVAGLICPMFLLRPQVFFPPEYVKQVEAQRGPHNPFPHTRRVVTTSVAEHHLKVLWGEIGRHLTTAAVPLVRSKENPTAPLVMNYQEVRFGWEAYSKNPYNYLVGRVSEKGEGLAGHHAAYTLFVGDEASGLDDQCHVQAQGWAKKMLYFGNPNYCENFWRKMVKEGTKKHA